MTSTIPTGRTHTYLPHRYDRLRNCAEMIASDPNVENAGSFVNGEMLRVFIAELVEQRVLDGLSEHDAKRWARWSMHPRINSSRGARPRANSQAFQLNTSCGG